MQSIKNLKHETKQNDIIKTKNNKKGIQQFVETIELFLKIFKNIFF